MRRPDTPPCISGLRPLPTKRIVLEATGGYERALWLALSEAGLVTAVVNPRQVRAEGGRDKPQCASIPRPGGRNHLARTRYELYSAAMRSQVISRCSRSRRRGGVMRTTRSPSKRTPRT